MAGVRKGEHVVQENLRVTNVKFGFYSNLNSGFHCVSQYLFSVFTFQLSEISGRKKRVIFSLYILRVRVIRLPMMCCQYNLVTTITQWTMQNMSSSIRRIACLLRFYNSLFLCHTLYHVVFIGEVSFCKTHFISRKARIT
jgi:hypothetical protein